MKETKSKVLGIRLDKDLLNDFERACDSLPIALKPQDLLKSYIRSVVDISKNINDDTLYISINNGNLVVIDSSSKFQKIHITRGLYDINFIK
jgi:hypothetical protein